jgi:hypothetical protein
MSLLFYPFPILVGHKTILIQCNFQLPSPVSKPSHRHSCLFPLWPMFRVLLFPLLLAVSGLYYGLTGAIVGALARPAYIPAGDLQNREITPAGLIGGLLRRSCDKRAEYVCGYSCCVGACWYVLSIQLVCSPVCALSDLPTCFFLTSSLVN